MPTALPDLKTVPRNQNCKSSETIDVVNNLYNHIFETPQVTIKNHPLSMDDFLKER